mmetsp:Transcript_30326/g.71499  ORF Transcript_30326/g.71499 Transcript_30326/m.71499 type:complete len:108 (+) Transcript_30326:58-381(+)
MELCCLVIALFARTLFCKCAKLSQCHISKTSRTGSGHTKNEPSVGGCPHPRNHPAYFLLSFAPLLYAFSAASLVVVDAVAVAIAVAATVFVDFVSPLPPSSLPLGES